MMKLQGSNPTDQTPTLSLTKSNTDNTITNAHFLSNPFNNRITKGSGPTDLTYGIYLKLSHHSVHFIPHLYYSYRQCYYEAIRKRENHGFSKNKAYCQYY